MISKELDHSVPVRVASAFTCQKIRENTQVPRIRVFIQYVSHYTIWYIVWCIPITVLTQNICTKILVTTGPSTKEQINSNTNTMLAVEHPFQSYVCGMPPIGIS